LTKKFRVALVGVSLTIASAGLFSASAGATNRLTVNPSGGTVKFSTVVKNSKTCTWISDPVISGFNSLQKCLPGKVERSGNIGPNTSGQTRQFRITLTVRGSKTTNYLWTVTQGSELQPTTTTTISQAPSTTSTTSTTVPLTTTLWNTTGSGTVSGPQFTVSPSSKGWIEEWSYNCSNFGMSGNFLTSIKGYGSSEFTADSGTNQLGMSGSGTNHYYDSGTFSIEVISDCDWSETIIANGSGIPAASQVFATTLWSENGSGVESGPLFTVPSTAKGWIEQWSFNCSNFGLNGDFSTSITGHGSAQYSGDSGASQYGFSGYGTNFYYDTGVFNIEVISECTWSETVSAIS